MKCPFCGSERIAKEIAWGKTAETGNVGLKYKTGDFWVLLELYRFIPISAWIAEQSSALISRKTRKKSGYINRVLSVPGSRKNYGFSDCSLKKYIMKRIIQERIGVLESDDYYAAG